MGLFYNLPIKKEFSNIQWDLSIEISNKIYITIAKNTLNKVITQSTKKDSAFFNIFCL